MPVQYIPGQPLVSTYPRIRFANVSHHLIRSPQKRGEKVIAPFKPLLLACSSDHQRHQRLDSLTLACPALMDIGHNFTKQVISPFRGIGALQLALGIK